LIDLLTEELANGRPCVVYLRQTATRDIQPRIEALIRQHVPGAVPYILKNTVSAERREKVIEQQVAGGANIIICNPELTKTGLDLIFAPTIIYAEIVFNLSTMMQAAARSYRLNQTHKHCKVIYLYYEGTMEHTAVQLMSRKQRAAKLLTGDVGLTGLDAITEGEGGFEQALLDAIAKDEALIDPSEMFKASAGQSEIDAEDAAYWNVEVGEDEVEEPALVAHADPVVQAAIELGGVLMADDQQRQQVPKPVAKATTTQSDTARLVRYVGSYLDGVHLIHDRDKRLKLQAKLLTILTEGVIDNEETRTVVGLRDPDFGQYPVHEETLIRHVRAWLKQHRFVFTGCEDEAAAKIVDLAKQAFGLTPVKLNIFEKLQQLRDEELQSELSVVLKAEPPTTRPARRKKLDLLAVPEDKPEGLLHTLPMPKRQSIPEEAPVQLALF